MADSIDETLKEITPCIRAELNKLGYPIHIPASDDLLQETIIRLWKALENRNGPVPPDVTATWQGQSRSY